MKKVSATFELLVAQFRRKAHVHACSSARPSDIRCACALAEVQILPGAELCAHGRPNKQDRLLLALGSANLVAFVLVAEVPRLVVIWVDDCQIKSEPRS